MPGTPKGIKVRHFVWEGESRYPILTFAMDRPFGLYRYSRLLKRLSMAKHPRKGFARHKKGCERDDTFCEHTLQNPSFQTKDSWLIFFFPLYVYFSLDIFQIAFLFSVVNTRREAHFPDCTSDCSHVEFN